MVATPVLAYLYRAPLSVSEGNGTSYTELPVVVSMNNDWLAANGFMDADALDTRVQTLAGSNKPWMVVDDKTLFSIPVPASSQTNLYFSTGETSASVMNIIAGYNGYITTADIAALEPGNNFEFEWDGYVDTSYEYGKMLMQKWGALDVYVNAAGQITADMLNASAGFPTVAATNTGVNDTAATSHTFNLPAGIVAGNLLIVFATADASTPAAVFTFPDGWAELYQSNSASYGTAACYYKIADGTEGATITVTTDKTQETSHTSYRITGFMGVPEAINNIAADSINPDPPSLTASWGADNNLWIAAEHNDGTASVAAVPAGYGGGINAVSGGGGCSTGTSQINNAAATENPGVYNLTGAEQWITGTVVVAGDYTNQASVVITGIASGEHTVTVAADAVNFWISVDASVPAGAETVALAGSTTNDTANDWYWMYNADTSIVNGVTPYLDSIVVDVAAVETMRYEPVTMIIGDELPDETGTYDGTFTWGSNPSGVTVTLGSMTSSGQTTTGSTDTGTTDSLPVVGGADWNTAPDVSGALLTNPFRPIVTAVSDNTTLSERQVWVWLGIVFVAFVTILVGSRVRGHHLITGVAAGAAITIMVVMTIFPILTLIVVALAIWGGLVSERSPSL